ncbi:MAG: hypothetical protein AB1529_04390 [Candidatus Micrarchaeota archaeon]
MGPKVALFLLAALSLSSAATMLDSLAPALGVVAVLVVIILAACYMVAESINAQQLKAWVKQELRELIVALILFVAVIGLFHGDKPAVEIISGKSDYKADALATIDGMITRATDAYRDMIYAYHAVSMRTGFSTNLVAGYYVFASTGGVPSSGYSSFMIFFNQATTGLTNTIFIYKALKVLLDFFLAVGDKLIYLAFIFRIIPFTRQMGNTLIAMVIGAYVIFPFSLFMLDYSHNVITVPSPDLPDSALEALEFVIPPGATFICGEWYVRILVGLFGEIGFALPPCIIVAIATLGAGFQPCWEILTKVVYPIIMQIIIPITWGLMLAFSTFLTPDIGEDFDAFLPFLKAINNLVVVTYVDTILVAIITIVGTKSISAALGGEYLMPGIQRLV